MNRYVSASAIKTLREKKHLTQSQLAEMLCVSDKTISKWETAKGLPDISLLEPLAKALGISVTELLSGEYVTNTNKSSNMLLSKLYVCPICGNVIRANGQAVISCCGVNLPVLEADDCDDSHEIKIEEIENEIYVTVDHPMSKEHYISFFAYVTTDRFEMIKLYPEGDVQGRFALRGSSNHGIIFAYCNRHGLFRIRI
jgi:transcriptional regulator with XRE-family HTH domain/desulfoferrodoxin (superoxide reductase-like protein)